MDLTNQQVTLRQARIEELEAELAKEREKGKLKEKQISDLLAEVVFEVSTPRIRELEDKISAMALEALSAEGQWIEHTAAQQATIAEMKKAIAAWERAEAGQELQEAEAKLIVIMNIESNLDALHEARALECERLADVAGDEPEHVKAMFSEWLREEAAAHRARKEEK
ncbi:MAG TPA: hypothetical protein PLY42_13215 [Nitrospira sp.]|nr:hypothetical protein [Nitrospira sp.]HMZ98691.1 hypothetical protein [Nitrospira sp.]